MRFNWEYETCKCCTREQRLAWHINNELWQSVVIEYYKGEILCLECFLRMADDRRIPIYINDIEFLGLVQRAIPAWVQMSETFYSNEEIEECFACAERNGYTKDDACKCNGNDLQCKGCPLLESVREEATILESILEKDTGDKTK